ncbi:MAG TPA: alpha/beta hydrolase [Acidimicrobiales bacterium]|nr:alpha/beta hydrolase [Acidimicrobiales bacterium]
MRSHRVRAGSVDIAVLESGPTVADGGRPLLLVHGFPAAKEDFAHHLDALGALGFHAVSPDQRGHGESDKPHDESAYSLAILADDLLALADALGWPTFTLLGHSMGGMVAQTLAIKAPERLEGLILMDTSHGHLAEIPPDLLDLAKTVIRDGGMAAYLEASKALEGGGPLDTPAYQRMIAEDPSYEAYGDRKTLNVSPHMWLGLVDELVAGSDRLDQLRAVDVPTLVIVGEQDTPFLGHSQRMAEAMPRAELVVLPDAGHSPQFENPRAWWDAVSGWLRAR